MIDSIFELVIFALAAFFAIILLAVLCASFKYGKNQTRTWKRSGYNLKTWASGEIPKPNDGGSADVIEGLELCVRDGKLTSVRQTRTISAEVP